MHVFSCDNTAVKISCTVQRIIFRDCSTGYAVLSCMSGKDAPVLTGQLASLKAGERITAQGEWTDHPRYG
nr:hypothetical protein [Solobacterium sp.]